MNKEEAIRFAGLMESYLNIPSFVCEYIEKDLINGKYRETIEYVIQRRNEIETKEDYKSYQDIINMYLELQQENKQLKYKYYQLLDDEELLQMKIDKAIKYIKDNNLIKVNKEYLPDGIINVKDYKLLEILKGGE